MSIDEFKVLFNRVSLHMKNRKMTAFANISQEALLENEPHDSKRGFGGKNVMEANQINYLEDGVNDILIDDPINISHS